MVTRSDEHFGVVAIARRALSARPEPLFGSLTVVLLLAAWEAAAAYGWVNAIFVSRPSAIAQALVGYMGSENFLSDAAHSGRAFLGGLGLSVLVGIVVGSLMGWYPWIRYALDYVVSMAYSAPRIALIPVLILWFGIGIKTEVAVIFLISVFPVVINTVSGIRTVDDDLIELARSLHVRRMQMFVRILLPAAVPSILAGVRIAIGTSLIGLVVAEFLAATQGIGHAINDAASNFQPAMVFAGVVLITVVGLVLTEILKRVEAHFDRWRLRSD